MNKKEVLEIVDKVYNKLDNILTDADNVRDTVRECFSMLEEIPKTAEELDDEEEE